MSCGVSGCWFNCCASDSVLRMLLCTHNIQIEPPHINLVAGLLATDPMHFYVVLEAKSSSLEYLGVYERTENFCTSKKIGGPDCIIILMHLFLGEYNDSLALESLVHRDPAWDFLDLNDLVGGMDSLYRRKLSKYGIYLALESYTLFLCPTFGNVSDDVIQHSV